MPIGTFIGNAFSPDENAHLQRSLAPVLRGPASSNENFIKKAGELVEEYRKLWVPLMTSTGAHPAEFDRLVETGRKLAEASGEFKVAAESLAKAAEEFKAALNMLNEQARSLVKQHLVIDGAITSFSEIERAADLVLLSAQAAQRLSRSKQRFRKIDLAERVFVELLAKHYFQIYKEPPSGARDGVFYKVLKAIAGVCDGQKGQSTDVAVVLGPKLNVKEPTLKGVLSTLTFSQQPLSRGRKRRAK